MVLSTWWEGNICRLQKARANVKATSGCLGHFLVWTFLALLPVLVQAKLEREELGP